MKSAHHDFHMNRRQFVWSWYMQYVEQGMGITSNMLAIHTFTCGTRDSNGVAIVILLAFAPSCEYPRDIPSYLRFDLIYSVSRHFQQYFIYIMATRFRDGRSRSTRREPPTMGKQLVIVIILRVECTLFVIYKAGREPTPY